MGAFRRTLPSNLLGGSGTSSSRAQPTAEETWATLPRSSQLQALGAPKVDIEQALQQERLLGPTGARTIAGARGLQGDPLLGIEEPAPRQGLLEVLGDFMSRPQSAVTGFVTGLTGMERLRQTRDASGVSDGELFDRPERVEGGLALAFERFRQGISGEEKFQAADFGALAYDREEADTGERFIKSAAGFVLDVALDPLTYLSFGGSILGRRAGAVAVNSQAHRNVSKVTSKLSADELDVAIRNAVRQGGTDESIIVANLKKQYRIEDPGLLNIDQMLQVLSYDKDLLATVANDAIAYTAAGMYRWGGAGATYKYLTKEFGEAGRELWNTLPADLRGGVRIRVPLSGLAGRAMGTGPVPMSLRLSPLRTGTLGEITGAAQLSNGARQAMRERALLRPIGDNLSGMTGGTDRATAVMLYRRNTDTAGKWFGRRQPEVDPKLRATSWASSNELEASLGQFRAGVMSSARQLMEPVTEAQNAYRQGRELGGEQFDELFDKAIRRNLAEEVGPVVPINVALDLGGRAATEQEILAYSAAFDYQRALRTIENQLVELENRSSGFSANLLENYWPRIVDDMEREMSGRGTAGFANLRNRNHFVAEFNPDGTVKRWMTPREIGAQVGSPKFVENAEVAMSAYLVSMNRFIQEERLFQHLLDRGVVFRGGPEAIRVRPNLTEASRRWIETSNRVEGRRAALQAIGRDEGATPLTGVGVSGRSLDEVVAEAERLGQAIQGGRVHGPRLAANYLERASLTGARTWASADGVTITALDNGTFSVTRQLGDETEWLTPASRWSRSEPDGSFLTFDDARAFADRNMATVRKRQFVDQMQAMQDEFFENYTAMMRGFTDLEHRGLNPFSPGNVPLDHQNEYFEVLSDAIRRFGDASGMVNRETRAKVYRDERWGAGRGAAFAPVSGGNGPKMRQYWADRMDRLGVFAPETVVDDVRRIFRAIDNPEGFKKWVEEYYKPFYALQKSLMTSQRGPGYILRNIQGGMWNAYIVGTNARHFGASGGVKIAEYQARARAKKQAPDSLKRQAEIMQAEFRKILEQRFGANRGGELYNAWELFEQRGLRGREIASRTPGTQAVATATGDLSGDIVRIIPDADQNMSQRLAEWGTSHWWARTMAEGAQGSEDYLRFAAFLRGTEMYGVEDGGRAASLMVKASQFDYSDLSQFEAETVKMLVPFYTWTRNNVPLQFRAIISEPGKIQKAIRLNDAMADAFGEPDEPEEPLPGYVRERFGWRIREDLMTGPSGDALSAGMVFGEPLVDVNRLFGTATTPGRWGLTNLNWREVANNLNPAVKSLAPALTAMELSTGGTLPREEEAPAWASFLRLGRVTPEGERVMSARALRAVRDIVVPLGMAERYAPQLLGNDRLQRRWYTSLGSAILGLPVSTLDPYQTTAEMRTQERRLRGQFEREMGEEYPARVGYVREALKLGATPAELQFIRDTLLDGQDVSDAPIEDLDVYRMRDTLRFIRRIEELRRGGVPEETLRMMGEYFKPRTDAEMGVRAGGPMPLTAEQLSELGETPESVAMMTDAERAELMGRYALRNPEWKPGR